MSISPRPVHFYMEKIRNCDSDNGSCRWPDATKKRSGTTSLLPDSCQVLVPNSDMWYSEVKYFYLCYMTGLCMERGAKKKPE